MTVDSEKQKLFMHRVLFLHEVATRRGGKSSNLRLSLQEWNNECDIMCFLAHVLLVMKTCVDDMGNRLFSAEVIDKTAERAVEGSPD